MKKGFTLLELIIVIIILGVLATLGFTQYGRMVERARGAEPRTILGDIRKLAAAYALENGNLTGLNITHINVGPALDQIPSVCRSSHYFMYSLSAVGNSATSINATATRCTALGKTPNSGVLPAGTISLYSNVTSGTDIWLSPTGY